MRVLIACEFSGIVRDAFAKRGHHTWSCDLLPTERLSAMHLQGDVKLILDSYWDMMIAFPPCTYLCNSGVRWLKDNPDRYNNMLQAALFFNQLLLAPIPRIAIENPIQHKYAREFIRKYDQIVQPYWFGHPETKQTCLWLKGLPKLAPTNSVKVPRQKYSRVALETPSPNRWKERSRTYTGLAEAMVEQWGSP